MRHTSRLLVLVILGMGAGAALGRPACAWTRPPVSAVSRLIPIDVIHRLPRGLTLDGIIETLGPAARDIGSGLYGLQWDTSDGRVFSVSGASPCRRPMLRRLQAATAHRAPSAGPRTPA